MFIRKTLSIVLALLFVSAAIIVPAGAEKQPSEAGLSGDLVFFCDADNGGTAFRAARSDDGGYVLFLPAGADASRVPFAFPFSDGSRLVFSCGPEQQIFAENSAVDIDALLGGQRSAELIISLLGADGETVDSVTVTAAASSSVGSVFLMSDDPAGHGRHWVETSKENRATGSLLMLDENGEVTHTGVLEHIKGRGNSTWGMPKKPYQIKLAKKDDLLDTGDRNNAAKKWILLANYADSTLMSNQIALELGAVIGMEYNIGFEPVDLYYDGEYRGSYLLTEKVEIGKGRVDIYDLEAENEAVNEGVDLVSLPTKPAFTENGARYSYCEGMNDPDDYSGGYLLEMDYAVRALEEVCWIETSRGNWVTVKSPEFASREQMDYIASVFQSFENALYNGGVDPDTGKLYSEIVDVDSAAQTYLINEFAKNTDGFMSSTYLYLDRGADKMKMGPLWDFDLGFRERPSYTPFYTVHHTLVNRLYRNADFRAAVSRIYCETMYPFIRDVLLASGQTDGGFVSYDAIAERMDSGRLGDALLWGKYHYTGLAENYTVSRMRLFIENRADILKTVYENWADRDDEYHVFIDVPESAWFAPEIWRAEDAGIVRGDSQMAFYPYARANRAQTVQILYNMSAPDGVVSRQIFDDADSAAWFGQAITWAYDRGIARGVTAREFRPGDSISRQDIVVLLHRYYGEPEADASVLDRFSDRGMIGAYAVNAMAWAVENGVMGGMSENTLSPGNTATRAELAALILRCSERFGAG